MDDWVHGQESVIVSNIAIGVLRQGKPCRQLFVYPQELLLQVYRISNGCSQFSHDVNLEVFFNLGSVSLHLTQR